MGKHILVTGINGFVGKHLARELHSRGWFIIGIGREPKINSEVVNIVDKYLACDLTNRDDVSKLPIEDLDAVINLAGLAKQGESFKKPELYNHVNVAVLTILGRKMAEEHSRARMIAVSTGAVYDPQQPMPLVEDSKISLDSSPYVMSKLQMEKAADELREQNLDCIIVRPFNHIGPGQESGFLVPDLYEKIQSAGSSGQPILVGNLDTKRDYTDVRDVVRAYADLAEQPDLTHTVYNVCSGYSISGRQVLELLLDACNVKGEVEVKVDPELIRPGDPEDLYGSYERLKAATGWVPKVALEKTIADFVTDKG